MSKGLKMLFGGSSQKSQSTSAPVDMTPAEFKGLRGGFAEQLSRFAQTGGPDYAGPLTAALTEGERDMLARLREEGGTRRGLLERTLQGEFLPGQPGSNPALDAAIEAAQRPTLTGLTRTLSRGLPSQFALRGQRTGPGQSSAFDRAGNIATEAAANTLKDIATDMSFRGYESERNRQTAAIALSQADVDTMMKNLQAQGLPRLIEDVGIQRGMDLFKQKSTALMEALRILAAVTSPHLGQQSQSTASGTTYTGVIPGLKGTVVLPPGAPT